MAFKQYSPTGRENGTPKETSKVDKFLEVVITAFMAVIIVFIFIKIVFL